MKNLGGKFVADHGKKIIYTTKLYYYYYTEKIANPYSLMVLRYVHVKNFVT